MSVRRGPLLLAGLLLALARPARGAPAAGAGVLAGKHLPELRALLGKRPDASRLLRGLETFLDDDPGGARDRLDAGHETLGAATYLLLRAPGVLGLTAEAIEAYRAKARPVATSVVKLARELRFDREGAGLAQRSHQDKTAALWRPHFEQNKQQILSAASVMRLQRGRTPGRPLVVVLGAGSCADIPLRELVAGGHDVVLVDLDEASLRKGIAMQLAPAAREHVRIELRDLSAGAVEAVTREADRIMRARAGDAARARSELGALFRRQAVPVPQLEGAHRADLLVSSLLMSQLPVFPSEEIGRRFAAAFKEPLARGKDLALAQSAFGDRLFDAHLQALADFVVRQRATVFLSSDLFLAPTYYDPATKREVYGEPAPVVGNRGQPLLDLDHAFAKHPGLRVVSRSSTAGQPGSDLWAWNQGPASLASMTETIKKRTAKGVVDVTVRRGFMRLVDSLTLVPR